MENKTQSPSEQQHEESGNDYTHRWNLIDRVDGLYYCDGLHDKAAPCHYQKLTKDTLQSLKGEAYGRGVTAGKLEALNYTPEERERYGQWSEGVEKLRDHHLASSLSKEPVGCAETAVQEKAPREIAIEALTELNPRFALFRKQDPEFREHEVVFWTKKLASVVHPDTKRLDYIANELKRLRHFRIENYYDGDLREALDAAISDTQEEVT